MKQELIPYYITRGILAIAVGALIAVDTGHWWLGIVFMLLSFAAFLWYAHGGMYRIEPSTPLFPLRRDERAAAIRNRSLVWAVACGGITYAGLALAVQQGWLNANIPSLSLAVAVLVYMGRTIWMHLND